VPGLVDKLVPSVAAVVEDVVVGLEDAVRQPVVAHELPNVLGWIQLGTFGRQRQEGDIGRDDQLLGRMPAGLVEQENRTFAGSDSLVDLLQMQVHRPRVAHGKDEAGALAVVRADRAEDVG